MSTVIQPNFPTNIQKWLSDCDSETQNEIQELFTLQVPNIPNCGEKIFKADDYNDLREVFENLGNDEQDKFVETFFDAGIFEHKEDE